MPFDNLPVDTGAALAKLADMEEFFSRRWHWKQGAYIGLLGLSMCMDQRLAMLEARELLSSRILTAAEQVTGVRYPTIVSFNDAVLTRFKTVRSVLARTRENLAVSPEYGQGIERGDGHSHSVRERIDA